MFQIPEQRSKNCQRTHVNDGLLTLKNSHCTTEGRHPGTRIGRTLAAAANRRRVQVRWQDKTRRQLRPQWQTCDQRVRRVRGGDARACRKGANLQESPE
jgi:hypothetical protein